MRNAWAMAAKTRAKRPERNLLLGERLRITREAMRLKQKVFAQRAGVSEISYNQWENGAVFPPAAEAIKLCKTYGLTLDWIYMADPRCLPSHLHDAIRALAAAEAARTPETTVVETRKRVRSTAA